MDYEPTAKKVYTAKKPTKKHIVVKDGSKLARKNAKKAYKNTIKLHKQAVKKLRGDIKKHKLLMKQATITYKLTK